VRAVFKSVSCISRQSYHDKIFTVYPTLHLLFSSGVHLLARLKGQRQENQRAVIAKKFAPDEGKWRIKNLKSKGYENCSTKHKLILTHFGENLNFYDKINLHLDSFPHPQQKAA
jgi:hypothetical protein